MQGVVWGRLSAGKDPGRVSPPGEGVLSLEWGTPYGQKREDFGPPKHQHAKMERGAVNQNA